MNWEKIYQSRLTTAEEAVSHVRSGDRVVVGHATGSPETLLNALVDNRQNYGNGKGKVELVHMVSMGPSAYCGPECSQHFVHNSLFAGATSRAAIDEGRAEFTPCHFSQVPTLFKEGILPVDVCLCMLSPPDEHGFCSFGVSVDYTKPAAESAKTVIAEISPSMPRTLGDTFIHVSKLDYIVECDDKPIVMNPPKLGPIDEAIGGHCAELIRDGDVLQLGIGSLPDAILGFLKEKRDLGIHSEMFSDGVADLVESGVITGARKTLHPGKLVASFLMGTEKLYNFVHNNPMVEMYPVDYTNDPSIIGRNDNMISINSALQVDFTGQVVSDTIGLRQYSGTGGQVDFVRGTSIAKGGRSILAFPSTAAKGTLSKIVPVIDTGACVTTLRTDVHYIVTEYGIADLRGRSVSQRAKALIGIAHPDFRDQLKSDYRKRFGKEF